ncbi:MAG: hypothetical protein JW993_20505 [Sedimentisphaerales bacterium]|nr:hypothetical protein [Sedimentisphaerales bacterium]
MKVTEHQIEHVMAVARRTGFTFVVMVDETTRPSVALVEECSQAGTEWISIKAWTPVSLPENPATEPKLALLVWDAETGHGYQVTGRAVQADPTAVLNGYSPIEAHQHFPQVEERVLMVVDDVTELVGAR